MNPGEAESAEQREQRKQTRVQLLSIKEEYFEQDGWYAALCESGLESLTFRSEFLLVSFEEAEAIVAGSGASLAAFEARLAAVQERLGAERIFVKFVRSPKDATVIYDAAARRLVELLRERPGSSAWELFGESRQEAMGVSTAREAVALLSSSGRVCAAQGSEDAPEGGDLWWAMHGHRFGDEFSFERMRPRLMVREFLGALPLQSEWRAFVWDRRCGAISQYFYDFAFEELQAEDVRQRLAADFQACLARLEPVWDRLAQAHAMLDFAWSPGAAEPITIIEINPFDPGKGLGHSSSLALFDWAADGERLRSEAEGIEVRITPIRTDVEEERATNQGWSTVGTAARDALRSAMQQLSFEELERSHVVTRIVSRKLGVRPAKTNLQDSQGTGKDKGKGKGKEKAEGKPSSR